jgi:hypothetical protein
MRTSRSMTPAITAPTMISRRDMQLITSRMSDSGAEPLPGPGTGVDV